MGKRKTTLDFVKEIIEVYGDKYLYDQVTYTNNKTSVSVYCKKHKEYFKKRPSELIRGSGCQKCSYDNTSNKLVSTTEDFVKKAIEVHGDKYNYDEVVYLNAISNIKIYCKYHNNYFYQRPSNHLSGAGCKECGHKDSSSKQSFTTEEFIKKAKQLHGDTYDYSITNYDSFSNKVEIICKQHGSYKQWPATHLGGGICPNCSRETRYPSAGWGYKAWEQRGNNSKWFDSFKLYIIKCYDKDSGETFIKIGKTFNTIQKRYKNKYTMPYKYEVLKIVEGSADYISRLEHRVHKVFKNMKYSPVKTFDGEKECYTIDININSK